MLDTGFSSHYQGGNVLPNLERIGWDVSSQIDDASIARVISVQKNSYRITDGKLAFTAHLSGRFLNQAEATQDYPAVGDWVEVVKLEDEGKAVIQRVLPRKSQFIRQAAGGRTEAQVLAANMDSVLIVNSCNHDLNVRRLERYLIAAYESGATPMIVLTKIDACPQEERNSIIQQVEAVAMGVPIIAISSVTGEGLQELLTFLPAKKTAVLLGSSGVGKSTLVNTLLDKEIQATKTIREDDSKGRHTTTHREMFFLPNDAMLIDTPGIRELQLWENTSAIETTFEDVEAYGNACKFKDCKHESEPGCRIRQALESGELSEARYQSYQKLQKELAYEKRKQDQKARLEEKNRWKQISKFQKKLRKH